MSKQQQKQQLAHTTSDSFKMSKLGKVFNDPIHGHMELHPLLVKIIDTPQFQRLRNIKQLGGAYFVYPGASHNRFEHSLGVAHLAGEFARILQTKQPELKIKDRDILCVQIAGLCHDLGHGPFSHLYDDMFLPRARTGETIKHESLSVDMFDHLVKCNGLEEEMKKHGLKMPKDMPFIKEMIRGPLNTQRVEWPYEGRKKEKSFLYEIVANKRNGIDVDKFDYFARDCQYLGIQTIFDHQRFFAFARVCKDEHDEWQICSRDKEKDNLCDLFYTRSTIHRKACYHKVNELIQAMITEAFIKADPYIQIKGSEGRMFTLSTAVEDMEAYTKLTDQVFDLILNPPSHIFISVQDQSENVKQCLAAAEEHPDLQDAREILNRILRRDFYKFVGKTKRRREKPTEKEIAFWKEELAQANREGKGQDDGLKAEDFAIVITTVDHGKKVEDCISKVSFYSKFAPDNPFKEEEGSKPKQIIKVYFKKNDKECLTAATRHFIQWCQNKGFPVLKNIPIAKKEMAQANPDRDAQDDVLMADNSEVATQEENSEVNAGENVQNN